MLTLILGRAGTGKTAYMMNEIKRRMDSGERNLIMLVPEQYSHDAERNLCAVCGDKLSLHGEVLSFTRLCSRVFAETGGAEKTLSGGGQILLMYRAVEAAAQYLRVFGAKNIRPELLEKLLMASRELKSLNILPWELESAAARVTKPFSDKLRDLSLILSAYDSLTGALGADPFDRLTELSERISQSTAGDSGCIFFDGFIDFTAQELRVIEEFLKKNADIAISLTCGGSDEEIFMLPRRTVSQLTRLADKCGVEIKTVSMESAGHRTAELAFMEKHLFGYGDARFSETVANPRKRDVEDAVPYNETAHSDTAEDAHISAPIKICAAPDKYAECEYAAARILSLVRSGYRWRDIGVMARDWTEYGPICENVFTKYGVEFFSGGRVDILQRPPVALIDSALEIVSFGWEYKPVFKYIKTGLAGIDAEECAELENYVLKWSIRGALWRQEWTLPPSGYGNAPDTALLERLNNLRRRITVPLNRLREGIKGTSPASDKLKSLYGFLEEIGLPQSFMQKSERLRESGELRLADEYVQLWDVIKDAFEQFNLIIGDAAVQTSEFRRLFTLVLSQYDVGVIPVALDRTALGDMAMSRRRDLKCLILLGATDENMPRLSGGGGLLTDNERAELNALGTKIPSGQEERMCRELNMLYSTLTLPSEELIVSYPAAGKQRPSFIVKRIEQMFGIDKIIPREEEYMPAAKEPCFELAAFAGKTNNSRQAAAAREFFVLHEEYDNTGLEKLSRQAAERLYGRRFLLSASRADKFYSCPFAHFLQSGLKLVPRVPAGFDAPAAGTFMHYILENVSREIKESGGFKNVTDSADITAQWIERYVRDVLMNFEGKNGRFIYLFRRLEENTKRIVADMLEELKSSDFVPLDFELDFTKIPGADLLKLRGFADRVDGWEHNGKLYLRVVDYKTGKKEFILSDVLHGLNMQLLIYLFALEKYGKAYYGKEIAPASVLYLPARDVILKAPRSITEEELKKQREKEKRRGGLVLAEPAVLEAMENGGVKRFLPVKQGKDGLITGDSLVSAGQLELLSEHVDAMLKRAADKILDGSIECSPYYKNETDNACLYCVCRPICTHGGGDESRRFVQKLRASDVWSIIEKGTENGGDSSGNKGGAE